MVLVDAIVILLLAAGILTIVLERREAGLYSLVTARDGTKSEKSLYRKKMK